MLVAFDIDDTLGDCFSASVSYLNYRFGKSYTIEDMYRWVKETNYKNPDLIFFEYFYGLSTKDVIDIFANEAGFIYPFMQPFKKAREEVWGILRSGGSIVYITGREVRWRKVTKMWLRQSGFPEAPIYFDKEKVNLALSLGVSLFYEDVISMAERLMKAGIPCMLIDSIQNSNMDVPGVRRLFWNDNLIKVKAQVDRELLYQRTIESIG